MSRSLAAVLLALLYVLPGHFVPAAAQTPDATLRHAIAKIGEPQVPKGFTHFEWVNPTAPKGGTITLSFGVKQPGPEMVMAPASLAFDYRDRFGVAPAEAYE